MSWGSMAMSMSAGDFLDYVKNTKSKNTYKEYRRGVKKFIEWYFKKEMNDEEYLQYADRILEERRQDWISGNLFRKKRFTREIEKFHKWLITKQPNRKPYAINSARTFCLGILQLFRFYEMTVVIPTGSDVSKTVISTKDFVPSPEQYRKMYQVADNLRDRLIISMGLNLAWRIGDFMKQRRDELPNLESDASVAYELITEKENVIAKSFISQETVYLLKEYLPTVKDRENPHLFPSNGKGFFDPESVNRVLRKLAEKAKVRIPKNKRLRFHAFRKRFLSECANLSVDVNTAKVLCGKSVEKAMLTYLSEVEHRQAFVKVHERLRLTAIPMRKTRETASELEKRVDRLERMINILSAINPDMVKKADEMLISLGVTMTESQLMKTLLVDKLKIIDEKQSEKDKAEYKKLIESNNNNNH